jgi:anti-sigma factor RsiW
MRTTERKTANRGTIRHCREAIGLLTEYMEGDLTPGRVRQLEAHLAGCSACAGFLDSLRKTRDAARTLGAREVPEECRRALRTLLKDRLGPKRS